MFSGLLQNLVSSPSVCYWGLKFNRVNIQRKHSFGATYITGLTSMFSANNENPYTSPLMIGDMKYNRVNLKLLSLKLESYLYWRLYVDKLLSFVSMHNPTIKDYIETGYIICPNEKSIKDCMETRDIIVKIIRRQPLYLMLFLMCLGRP